MSKDSAIGVFDSGLGGLTVLSAIHRLLPAERTVYLGDTARVPYGTRSADTVIRYALNNAKALIARAPIKLLVVACNTASAVALDVLASQLLVPVIGVIEPGADEAMRVAPRGRIAVLATEGTIRSNAYERTLMKKGFEGEVISRACPLFVPLVEEGLIEGDIPHLVAERYISDLGDVDAAILGCTHYPMLLPTLQNILPSNASWVSSGEAVAKGVQQELLKRDLLALNQESPSQSYLMTDTPWRLLQLSEYFLGKPIKKSEVELIDVVNG